MAFQTRYEHFKYLVMSFSLANALIMFQAYINHALGDLLNSIYVVYLDDILIYSTLEEEHTQYIYKILK
jgi:hypothetical protein